MKRLFYMCIFLDFSKAERKYILLIIYYIISESLFMIKITGKKYTCIYIRNI